MSYIHYSRKERELYDYLPLIIIIGTCFFSSYALEISQNSWLRHHVIENFMGLLFVVFAMFKLLDLRGFADSFASYDIIAQHYPVYAYIYPCIEALLGLAYLSDAYPIFLHLFTIMFMGISAVGVINATIEGTDIPCHGLSYIFRLPLSMVSSVENIGMMLMAAAMLMITR